MKRLKTIFTLLLAMTIVFTAFSAFAAIPENGGAGTKLPFKSILNDEGQGSTATIADDTFGTVYRMTNSGGSYYRPSIEFTKIKDLSYAAGEYLYISFYWRAQSGTSPATYFNTETAFEKWGTPSVSVGTASTMNYDNWNKYEAVVPNNTTRTWTNMRLRIQFGGTDSTARSIDIANPVCYYLGAATGTDSADILAQFRETFSNDSSIASLSVAGSSVNLTQNPSSYEAGAAEVTAENIVVTTTNANALVKKELAQSGRYLVTVYSQKADVTAPEAGQTTTYTINYGETAVVIPANGGNGTALPFSGVVQYEGQGSTAAIADETFGTAYRMTNSGGTYYRPYLRFLKEQGVMFSAGEYLYISFYWRANGGGVPATYFNTQAAFETWSAPTNSVGTSATMNYGNWNKYSAVLTNGANRNWTDMRLVLQLGGADSTARSIDIANPVCYYLGAATGGTTAKILEAFEETFSDDCSIDGISINSTPIDLVANPTDYDAGVTNISAANVSVSAAEKAYVVKRDADGEIIITVYPQSANIIETAVTKSEYTITYQELTLEKAGNSSVPGTIRFATRLTIPSEKSVEYYGTFMIPDSIFEDPDANTLRVDARGSEEIASGQVYGSDLENIPTEFYDTMIYAWSYVKFADDAIVRTLVLDSASVNNPSGI